jgi:hypothetical protein
MRSWRAAGGPSKTSWKKFESQMLGATYQQIEACAYCIWQQEGRPEGRALDHWLQAELQLVLSSILLEKGPRKEASLAADSTARAIKHVPGPSTRVLSNDIRI